MKLTAVNLVCFSATNTTSKVMRLVAGAFDSIEKREYNLNKSPNCEVVTMGENELLIVGMPVYAGRIPTICVEPLKLLRGNRTPAIVFCVYGNRAYDDALLELKDILEAGGFVTVAAGAFVAQHSIFPSVAAGRPDGADAHLIADFAGKCLERLNAAASVDEFSEVNIKGNRPYRMPGVIPFHPRGSRRCNRCGACVTECPVSAISIEEPRRTDKTRCISCARCIAVCPRHSRHFGGLLYLLAGRRFSKVNQIRKAGEYVVG